METEHLTHSVNRLADALSGAVEFFRPLSTAATKHDLETATHTIMSAIAAFAATVKAQSDAVQAALDSISADIDANAAGIAKLDDLITQLQTTPGAITPEDQALLDSVQATVTTLGTNAAALKVKADSVNTAPPTPPAPPAPSA